MNSTTKSISGTNANNWPECVTNAIESGPLSNTARACADMWGRYNCDPIDSFTSIDTSGTLMVTIPSEQFHGLQEGRFLLKLCFPSLIDGDIPAVKIGIGYIRDRGNAVIIQRDDERADKWTNLNSNPIALSDLFEHGFIAEDCQGRVFNWFQNAINSGGKGQLKLTPRSEVRFTLRPTEYTDAQKVKRSNIAIWAIDFENAGLLAQNSNLLRLKVGAKPAMSLQEMQAKFGAQRLTNPLILPNPAATNLTSPTSVDLDEME